MNRGNDRLCRDCKHWGDPVHVSRTKFSMEGYPRDQPPDQGWVWAKCKRIEDSVDVDVWSNGGHSGLEPDANFGCILWEAKE